MVGRSFASSTPYRDQLPNRVGERHAKPMLLIAAHQLLEALTRRLGIVHRIVDELRVDGSRKVGEFPLVLDPEILGQGLQAVRIAGERGS